MDCDKAQDQGCQGGLPSNAFDYLIKNGGIDTEASYPYTGKGGACLFSAAKVGATISSWEAVSSDEDQLAAYVAAHGPVSIGINAGPMQWYMGGIANPPSFLCNPKQLDHGVLIVGFGEDGGKQYWIIKNSWGPHPTRNTRARTHMGTCVRINTVTAMHLCRVHLMG